MAVGPQCGANGGMPKKGAPLLGGLMTTVAVTEQQQQQTNVKVNLIFGH